MWKKFKEIFVVNQEMQNPKLIFALARIQKSVMMCGSSFFFVCI
jgi:hypothetical protein